MKKRREWASAKTEKILERRLVILDMIREGYSFQQIGDKLNMTRQGCWKAYKVMMAQLRKQIDNKVENLRLIQHEQNRYLSNQHWKKYHMGKTEQHEKGIDKCMKVERELWGLNAPTKIEENILFNDTVATVAERRREREKKEEQVTINKEGKIIVASSK